MAAKPVTAYEDRSVRFAAARNVLIAVWRDPPDRTRALALRALQKQIGASHREVAQLHVINPGANSPLSLSNDGRRELGDAMREIAADQARVAMAIEGTSFFVAAWRSIISTVLLFVRPRYPFKIFATRAEGAAWLARETATWTERADAASLIAAVEHVEAGLLAP